MWACPRGIDLRSRRLSLPDGFFLSAAMYEIPPRRYVPFSQMSEARRASVGNPAWGAGNWLHYQEPPRYFLATAFFLPATVRLGPRRVRALVRVRWPRTGRLRRWRMPR